MAAAPDQRAYILPPKHIAVLMQESPIFKPIVNTGYKVLFPFTPTIQGVHSAEYGPMGVTHTNYQYYSYQGSTSPQLSVSGPFYNQTITEAAYYLACVHFFRLVTKMRAGVNDPYRGAPPPILRFFAFGHLMYHNIPVVVRSFNFELNPQVDYIDVGVEQTEGQDEMYYQRVPTQSNLFLDLQTQYLPGKALNEWHIDDFAKGNLVKKGFI